MPTQTIEVLRIPGTLFPRGPFDENASYKFLNFVESGGNGYVCLQPCTGIPVTNTAYWFKFVFKGDKGDAFTYADLTAEQKAELVRDATAAAQAAASSAQSAADDAAAALQKFNTIKAAIDAIDPQSTEGSIQTLAAKQGLLEADLNALGPKISELDEGIYDYSSAGIQPTSHVDGLYHNGTKIVSARGTYASSYQLQYYTATEACVVEVSVTNGINIDSGAIFVVSDVSVLAANYVPTNLVANGVAYGVTQTKRVSVAAGESIVVSTHTGNTTSFSLITKTSKLDSLNSSLETTNENVASNNMRIKQLEGFSIYTPSEGDEPSSATSQYSQPTVGLGLKIAVAGKFNRVTLPVHGGSYTVMCFITDSSIPAGTYSSKYAPYLVWSKTFENLPSNSDNASITIDLGTAISVTANQYVTFLVASNSSATVTIGKFSSQSAASTRPKIRFGTGTSGYASDTISIGNTSYLAPCFTLQYIDKASEEINKINKKIAALEESIAPETLFVTLPDKIYAVVGDTLQLFYRGMILATNPYNYDILVTCTKGNQYPRYFEYTPTSSDVGSTTFKVQVKDNNGNVLGQATSTLVTVAKASSPQSQINIACFGDSLTTLGKWCYEAWRRLTGSNGTPSGDSLTNISFVGKKNNNGAGYFGQGGWSWSSYTTSGRSAYRFYVSSAVTAAYGATYTNNGHTYTVIENNSTNGSILCAAASSDVPELSGTLTKASGTGDVTITFTSAELDSQNPLWDSDNNKMTFVPYADDYCNEQIDVVYTLLTWNGLNNHQASFTSILGQVKTFADTLHSEFPNAKMKLMGLQMPSINGGMGANYGASGTGYADGFGMVATAMRINAAYQEFANQENYSSWVEYVDIASQFDTENNMPSIAKKVNVRSSTTEVVGTNGVHPADEGYNQIADVVYRNIIATILQ